MIRWCLPIKLFRNFTPKLLRIVQGLAVHLLVLVEWRDVCVPRNRRVGEVDRFFGRHDARHWNHEQRLEVVPRTRFPRPRELTNWNADGFARAYMIPRRTQRTEAVVGITWRRIVNVLISYIFFLFYWMRVWFSLIRRRADSFHDFAKLCYKILN